MGTTTLPTGRRAYHVVRVTNPPPPSATGGDVDLTAPWIASPIPWYVGIEPVVAADQEIAKSEGTILTQASLIVSGAYRADVTTASRLVDPRGAVFHVVSVESPGRRNFELVCRCSEVVS
jgi:head-tail adaptor